jgi:hypothetical protein
MHFFDNENIYQYQNDTNYTQPLQQHNAKNYSRHQGCTQPKKEKKKEDKRPRRSDQRVTAA